MSARARFYCCQAMQVPAAMPGHAVEVLLALVLDWIQQQSETPTYRGRSARTLANLTRSEWARGMRFLLDAGLVLSEPERFVVFVPVDLAASFLAPLAAQHHDAADNLDEAAALLPSSDLEAVLPHALDVDELRDLLDLD